MKIDKNTIKNYDKIYRTNLINSLSGLKSAFLIGTINENSQTNLSIVNSVVHIGANPPLIGFIQRPTSVERHTYENIINTGYYTINAVSRKMIEQAHQTSARYDRSTSEFEAVLLKEEYMSNFLAPFVKESPIKIGVTWKEELDIKANNTKLIVGNIEFLEISERLINNHGNIDFFSAECAGVIGLDTYFLPQKEIRLSYAKPTQPLKREKL